MRSRIRFTIFFWTALLFIAGCGREKADARPAALTTSKDSLPVINVSGYGEGLGKEDQAVGAPLEISAEALYGTWEWSEPGTGIILNFRKSTDLSLTYNARGQRVTNPDGGVSLLVSVPQAAASAPALAWGLDISKRGGWLADAKEEIGPPGPERSAEIQLLRSDLLHIKGRLSATIADIEFDGFLVKVPRNGIEDLADLVARLGSDRPKDVRIAAAKRLHHADDLLIKVTVPILVEWLKDSDAEIRHVALDALFIVLLPTKGPCPLAVVEAMFDKDAGVRAQAAVCVTFLEKLPEEALPLLFRAIQHEDRWVRKDIPSALAKMAPDDKRTVPALKKAIQDKDATVQSQALSALFEITHDFDLVVPHWLRAIEKQQDAMDAGLLDREGLREWADNIKIGAIGAAGKLHYHGQKHPNDLGKCLIKLLADKSPGIRLAAARSLGAIAGDNANSNEVLRDLKARDAVDKLLDDPNPSVVATAQAAIEKLK